MPAIGDDAQFTRTDVAFHLAIAMIPRNPIYLALHEAIVEWLMDQRIVSLAPRRAPISWPIESHRRVYEAIKARDPAAAGTGDADAISARSPIATGR